MKRISLFVVSAALGGCLLGCSFSAGYKDKGTAHAEFRVTPDGQDYGVTAAWDIDVKVGPTGGVAQP